MMNTTDLDTYLKSLEHAASELPKILEEWPTIEMDLAFDYADQIRRLLRKHEEVTRRASEERKGPGFAFRIASATARIRAFSALIEREMGFSVDRVLRTQAVSTETSRPPKTDSSALAA